MTAPLIDWRSRPPRTSRYHMALVEAAVAEYADRLWQQSAAWRLRWLRLVLRRIRPTLERLIALRTPSPEEVLLEQLIRQAGLEFNPDLSTLADDLAELARKIALQYGFLPNDPRTQTLEREFRRLLEGDLLSYWRTLTDPKVLARRLAELRGENKTTAQIIRQVQQEYGAGYYSAERLVRTLYNSGANRAQFEALRAAGYTHKRWLTARDNRVRVAKKGSRFDHRRMDGVTVPLEQPFTTPAGSRLMYPGDRRLGAPAGEVVNCRCTVVGVVLEGTMQGVEQERIQIGVHVLGSSSVLSRSKTKQIFRAINTAGLERFLREHPLARLDVVRAQVIGGRQINGEYDEQTQELWVNARRSERTFAQPFKLGATSTISALAPTLLEAIRRSLIHELAHHVFSRKIFATPLEGAVIKAAKLGTPLTFRASVGAKEYFAECFVAYTYERDLLQQHDPVGYAMIRKVREELGLP